MAEGYAALTAKEKAALRLLLAGHDAKSMARHLGLSVHTVNERLRDARRKLTVSSSKAAARILLEAEGPQLPADKLLGDAGAIGRGQTFDPVAAPLRRRAAWAVGGFAMIAMFVAALALSSTEPASLAPPAAATATVAESDASRAARDWLTLVDARQWQESWAATGESFRTANTPANWQAAAQAVHARLGPAVSRELISDDITPAPPNGVRRVRFRSDYPNSRGVIEILSLAREGDRWRVVGIYVD